MPNIRLLLALAVFAVCLCQGAAAQTEIDIPTAKRLAIVLVDKGQPRASREIAQELLRRNPDDPDLLIILSQAERGLGRFDAAIRAGRRGFRIAQTPAQKYLAARATAQALASDGQRTRAQVWLRLAGQHAPGRRAEAAVVSDYNYVRSRNPWSFSFSGSLSPTDNANDAPTSNEIVIGGLVFTDPTALPIPGTELTFSATAAYRLAATETRQSQFILAYDGRRVSLGRDAAIINPALRDRDFSADRLTLGWSAKFRTVGKSGVIDVSARLFADWNAGQRSQTGQALAGGYSWPVGNGQQLRIGAEFENLKRLDRPIRSSTTAKLSTNWVTSLRNRDRFGLQVTYADTNSQSFAVAHKSAQLRATYDFAKPVFSTRLGLAADFRTALFDTPLYGPDRRQDHSLGLSATATLTGLRVYGFSPVIELRHNRNRSNIARFDTRTTQISLSVRSSY